MKFILHTSFFIAFELNIRISIQSINCTLLNVDTIFYQLAISYFTNFQPQSPRIIPRLFTIFILYIEATFLFYFIFLWYLSTEIQKKYIYIYNRLYFLSINIRNIHVANITKTVSKETV